MTKINSCFKLDFVCLQKELEKQQELERQKELNERADKHYLLSLMKFRVLVPMKKLVQMANAKKEEAVKHHNYHILRLMMQCLELFYCLYISFFFNCYNCLIG